MYGLVPFSFSQLTASDVHFTIIKPLIVKYAGLKNLALVYSCLVVRSHFLRVAEDSLAHFNLNNSRAMMCELLAIKFIRYFGSNRIELVAVLTHGWNPLSGAPYQVVEQVKTIVFLKINEEIIQLTSALEMAISTYSKRFLSSPLTQTVINDIYSGRVVFTTVAQRSLVADNYKQRRIEIYDCRKAPILDHYRYLYMHVMLHVSSRFICQIARSQVWRNSRHVKLRNTDCSFYVVSCNQGPSCCDYI